MKKDSADNGWEVKTSGFALPLWFGEFEDVMEFSKLTNDLSIDVGKCWYRRIGRRSMGLL